MRKEVLESIGLGKKEREVYLATVKLSPAPASKIARESGLPRQTAYSILATLVEGGFIEQGDRAGVRQFIADPEHLLLLLERRRQDLERSREKVEAAIPELIGLQQSSAALPAVRYYEGEEGMRGQFEDILEQYKRGKSKRFRGYGINTFKGQLGNFLYDFVRRRHKYGVKTNLFIAKGPDDFGIAEGESRYGRSIKRIDMPEQHAGMYLVDDRAYLFSYKDKVGVMIENQAILDLLKDAFDDHWKKSE